MSDSADFIKIIQALEGVGYKVIEIKTVPRTTKGKISIIVRHENQ